jgi:hypothetical protein
MAHAHCDVGSDRVERVLRLHREQYAGFTGARLTLAALVRKLLLMHRSGTPYSRGASR